MVAEVMSKVERDRLFVLVRQGIKLKMIAERLGLHYDRVRRMVERAEKAGEVPAGTLSKLGVLPKKAPPQPKASALRVYAPARKVAADLGRCSCCTDPIEIAVEANGERLKLCAAHARDLAGSIELALRDAEATRSRFNGKFTL